MSRGTQEIDVQVVYRKRQVTQGLDGVSVQRNAPFPGDPPDFRNGLDRADLVVGVHDGDQDRLAGDRLPDFIGIDEAVAIDAMVSCGHCRHEYHGVVMPWWHHEMFGHACAAAFMAARQNL